MNQQLSSPSKIMLIRHAEKPSNSRGVAIDGRHEKDSLSIRGWQRAGALASLFTLAHDSLPDLPLAAPHFLFASKPQKRNGSFRPRETITPLAEKLARAINDEFPKHEYAPMLAEAQAREGVVLICWQHDYIPKIANLILGDEKTAPQDWHESRFDLIWIFDRDFITGNYRFQQVPQKLLAGDLSILSGNGRRT